MSEVAWVVGGVIVALIVAGAIGAWIASRGNHWGG